MKKHRTWQDSIVASRLYLSVYQYVILYTWQYRPARLSEINVVAAGGRTRPLRCFAIRGLNFDFCRLRNLAETRGHASLSTASVTKDHSLFP